MVLAPTRFHNPRVASGASQPEGLLSVKAPCLGAFNASLAAATYRTPTCKSTPCASDATVAKTVASAFRAY